MTYNFGIYFDVNLGWIIRFTSSLTENISNALIHDINIMTLDQEYTTFYSNKTIYNLIDLINNVNEVFESISEKCEYSKIEQSFIIRDIENSSNKDETLFNMKIPPRDLSELWIWSQTFNIGSFSFDYVEEFKGFCFSIKNIFGVYYPLPLLEYISFSTIPNSYLIDNFNIFIEDINSLNFACKDLISIGFNWNNKIPLSDKLNMFSNVIVEDYSNKSSFIMYKIIDSYKGSDIVEDTNKDIWLKLDDINVEIKEASINIILDKIYKFGKDSLNDAELLTLEYWSNIK